MFSHVHYVNGVMIVHSHPSDDDLHTHTEGQILTMAQVSSFVGIESVSMWIEVVNPAVFKKLDYQWECSLLSCRCVSAICLRAPPSGC